LQAGWPAWAANAAGAVFFLFAGRMAAPGDAATVYQIGVATFLVSVAVLLVGRRIERTLELFNWVLIVGILGSFLVLALVFVAPATWTAAAAGMIGFDVGRGAFSFLPAGVDWVLLAALVAYSGCGGITNITLSNWARDRGYGMGERVGYIPAAVGGQKVNLRHTGFIFPIDDANARRWRGWWRIVRADQWGVFFAGGILGMVLPALLYVTFLPRGTDIRGLGIAAALASSIGERAGPLLAGFIAFLGAWILFKTQLDQMEGMVRALTDMLWTGSERVRAWRGGDVRKVYYGVLAAVVLWGIIALRLAQPIVLLQIGANVAGVVFVITSLHLLYINTRLLPRELGPPLWRRATLVFMALFYGFFSALSIQSLFRS
jgi:hypothetical protein